MSDRRRIARAIRDAGYVAVRNSGGHVTYRHPDGRTFSMPNLDRARALDSGKSAKGGNAALLTMLRRKGVKV